MARTSQGILGSFSGAIGPVTGYVRNGQNIIRTRASRVVYKHTPLRTAQLEKIKICNRFTKAFSGSGFLNKSFPAYGSKGNGYNRATSILLNQAIMGDFPNLYLNYSQVMVSKGKLPAAENAGVTVQPDGNLLFTFANNSSTGTASAFDKVILVAYFEDSDYAVFILNGGMRKHGEAVLDTSRYKGSIAETWIGFLSNDECNASDSVYTGKVVL